jgi:D-sedoheptulose 7-phosphate isomerase
MAAACDLCLRVPTTATPLIQQLHITIGHMVCSVVEARLFPKEDRKPVADAAE